MSQYDSIIDELDPAWIVFMSPEVETPEQARWQKAFFGVVRNEVLKPLSQRQIDGIKTVLFIWKCFHADQPFQFVANILGNATRETGGQIAAIRETNGRSDKQVVARLNKWWASGAAQRFGVRSRYWRHNGVGHAYGRGIYQITHHGNYSKTEQNIQKLYGFHVDLDGDYNLVMDPLVSAMAAFAGSFLGQFRGKRKLSDYLNNGQFDYYNGRDIVNGDKRKVGREVAGYCKGFERAFRAAERAAPRWLSKPIDWREVKDVITDTSSTPVPLEVPGEATLATLRGVPTNQLRQAVSNASDLIKLAMIVLEERDGGQQPGVGELPSPPTKKENDMSSFDATKNILRSKTFWGLATAAIAVFAPQFQPVADMLMPTLAPDLDPTTVQNVRDSAQGMVQIVANLMAAFGLGFAGYGRKVATTKVTF